MYYMNPNARPVPHPIPERFIRQPLTAEDRLLIEERCRRVASAQSSRDIIRLLGEIDRLNEISRAQAASHAESHDRSSAERGAKTPQQAPWGQ